MVFLIPHNLESRVAVNEGVSDFLSRSSRSRVTVNGGEMMWPFSFLMLLQGGG